MRRFAESCWRAGTPAPAMCRSSLDTSVAGRSFGEALVDFAAAYADQTEADWQTLRRSKHATRAARAKAAAAKK